MLTNLAPNTVGDSMLTFTFDGISSSCDGFIARRSAAVPSVGLDRIDSADLHATHLDLGIVVHHQTGAIRKGPSLARFW